MLNETMNTPPVFKSDIPSEDWLQTKLRYVQEDGRNQWGVPRHMGPITGSFDRDLLLPVDLLAGVPGERAEQSNVRQASLQYIRDNFEKVAQEAVYIEVDPYGKAWVSEGNHRIMVAAEKGVSSLPVHLRYFSGGERMATDFAPKRLVALEARLTVTQNPIGSIQEAAPKTVEPFGQAERNAATPRARLRM